MNKRNVRSLNKIVFNNWYFILQSYNFIREQMLCIIRRKQKMKNKYIH